MSSNAATTSGEAAAAPSFAPAGGGVPPSVSHSPPPRRRPWLVRAYKWSRLGFDKLLVGLKALHAGIWLGLLDKPQLDAACEQYYEEKSVYQDSEYNGQGLFEWEQEMLDGHFPPAGRLLVTSAGGGREVVALHRRGYQLEATECNPRLVAFANQFLEGQGVPCIVRLTPPDRIPEGGQAYDAIVVGWGSYMVIQGRSRRIAFLRALRGRLNAGAPVLLSFFTRDEDGPYFRAVRGVAGALRALLRREPVDLGDSLSPTYVHYFRESELAAELQAAGFQLEFFGDTEYGHAVGRAT